LRSIGEQRCTLEWCALGAGGHAGFIRHAGDCAESLIGLLIGGDYTVGTSIDTWEVLGFTLAALEDTWSIRGRSVILATDTIEDVLAVLSSVGARWVASLQAELSSTHEVVPFDGLDVVVGVSVGCWEGVGEEEGTEGVTTLISTVRVEFSSRVRSSNVDEGLVNVSGDLDVVGGLDPGKTGEGTSWDQTGTVAWLGAPSNTFTFDVTDELVGFLGSPQAEVVRAVDDSGLALGDLGLSRGIANIVSGLSTTFTVIWVRLVRESGVGEGLGSKRNYSSVLGVDEEKGTVGQGGGDSNFTEHVCRFFRADEMV